MSMNPQDAVVLIPSLEPDNRLPDYVKRLRDAGFRRVVVVDDGSGKDYLAVFDQIDAVEGCHVVHYDVNRGKGIALKTGYKWIRENIPDCVGVITADADGQHTVQDCLKLAQMLCEGKRALYLGSRDFDLPNVPPKSRSGNKITSAVFKALYGQYLPDTQTGLRAFLKDDLTFMEEVEGERYEYEMKVLIACTRAKIPMIPITIETVYENDNSGTHFHPLRDSWRIYKVILGSFFKFMGASLICTLLDQVLFNIIGAILPGLGILDDTLQVWISTAGARVISAGTNFALNRGVVFKDKGDIRKSMLRYFLLAVICACASAGLVSLVSKLMPRWIAKIIVDVCLYFINYRVQECWVFRSDVK